MARHGPPPAYRRPAKPIRPDPLADIAARLRKALGTALAFHQGGDLTQAERLYSEVLAQDSKNFDACHLLGLLRHHTGRHRDALDLIQRATRLNLGHAEARSNLANVLLALDQPEAALAACDRAVRLDPRLSEARNTRGVALSRLNRLEEALSSYARALDLKPDNIAARVNHCTLLQRLGRPEEALQSIELGLERRPDLVALHDSRGHALKALNRPEEALASYDRALRLDPRAAEVHNNRGVVLAQLKRHEDALADFARATDLNPAYVDAGINRCITLQVLGRFEEAWRSGEDCLKLSPDTAILYNACGNALRGLGRRHEALAHYDRALALRPDYSEALNNRGTILRDLNRLDDALLSFEKAVVGDPANVGALSNTGIMLRELKRHEDAAQAFADVLALDAHHPYALGNLLHARHYCGDWRDSEAIAAKILDGLAAGRRVAEPFVATVHLASPRALLHGALAFVADTAPPAPRALWTGETYRHEKIRLAYLSADFRGHATACLMANLFERHDRDRFETFAVSLRTEDGDPMQARLRAAFDHFLDVSALGDQDVARLIRTWDIDIVVDLKGFTGGSRPNILAHRPAPIQINYLGYPGTMAACSVDYILADAHIVPPHHEPFYTETVVRLPDTYQVNDATRRIADAAPARPDVNLPETGFVFCCFNDTYKITPALFSIWMRLLARVEGSVLWLLEGNRAAARNLRREAEARGIAADRLVFAPRMPLAEHLARHGCADLFLDTLPCNAHTTASDALWAGLPLVTCTGDAFAGRVAGSLLKAVGLPDLIAGDLDAYEALALTLATAPAKLAEVKARLVRNRDTHALFDTDRFRRHLESIYVAMWEHRRRGEEASGFRWNGPDDSAAAADTGAPGFWTALDAAFPDL